MYLYVKRSLTRRQTSASDKVPSQVAEQSDQAAEQLPLSVLVKHQPWQTVTSKRKNKGDKGPHGKAKSNNVALLVTVKLPHIHETT